jgi:hypothetical protein
MILTTIVMIVAFSTVYINTAKNLKDDSLWAMKTELHSARPDLDFLRPDRKENPNHRSLITYVIDINEQNNTYILNGFGPVDDITENEMELINNLINSVNEKDDDEGILEKYNMRYLYRKTPLGKKSY